MNLPSRIKSSLALTEIEFPAYKPDELFDILRNRAYRNYMEHMIKLGLVRAEGFGKWRVYEMVV